MTTDQVKHLMKEAESLYKMCKYEEAIKKASESVELTLKHLGEEHPDYAAGLNSLAGMYKSVGRYKEALLLYQRFMKVRSKVFGENHPGFAVALNNLAGLYKVMGRYEEALPLYLKCMEIESIALGEEHPTIAVTLNNLAGLYRYMGRYEDALPLYQKSRDILIRHFGLEDPDYATTLNNLAGLYEVMGLYEEALPLYKQCIEIRRKVLGEEHPYYATTLDNLAGLYEAMGRYDEALPLYEECCEIRRKVCGEDHPDYATSLSSLGGLYDEMGWYEEALPLIEKCKEIRGIILGEEHPDYSVTLNNLAGLYDRMERYEEALPLYIKCLEIRSKVLGEKHPDFAETLDGLAGLYQSMGSYEEALPLYIKCKEIRRKALGEGHPSYSSTLNNLAALYGLLGRHEEALPLFLKCKEIESKALGEDHPSYAATLVNLARTMAASGDYEKAIGALYSSIEIYNSILVRFAFFFTERQLLSFYQTLRYPIEMLISLVIEKCITNLEAAEMALKVTFKNKAVIYEAIATHYQSALSGEYKNLQEPFEKLRQIRTKLAQNWLFEPHFTDTQQDLEKYKATIKELQAEHDKLESQIARQIPQVELRKRMHSVKRETIIKAMPANSYLLEFFTYHPHNFTAIRQEPQWEQPRYIVFLLSKEESDKLAIIDLGEAGIIDAEIASFLKSMQEEKIAENTLIKMNYSSQCTEEYQKKVIAAQNACRSLYKLLLVPIITKMKKKEEIQSQYIPHLIIAPDGEISRIPFEALVSPEGKFVVESYQVSYLTTSREILNFTDQSSGNTAAVIVADPDYNLQEIDKQYRLSETPKSFQTRNNMALLRRAGNKFKQLEFGRKEGHNIAEKLADRGMETKVFIYSEAVERAIKAAIRRPKILHIASHGFYLEDSYKPVKEQLGIYEVSNEEARSSFSYIENPFLRSGIALAGVNTVMSGKKVPDDAEDGVLFALDVLTTDLTGTELVVLSACETGLGDIRLGEGITGLRKAFVLAGAKALLITLWAIDDQLTLQLMNSFYNYLLNGQNKASSLRRAQLRLIELLRTFNNQEYVNPLYWAGFICVGDIRRMQGLKH